MTNFRLFQMKEFADDNFRFVENGIGFCKKLENIVGKGEIAHYKQFLLFPQCFQSLVLQTYKKKAWFGKGSIFFIFLQMAQVKVLLFGK